ncbi:hypothetical protein J2R76_001987 [Bradyrhizobium sp. USDA 4532]|nr:hypothetical protein [Bradyrhizobium sp. USDA 4545]MCP1918396.1 hypothetical protein [Bradyrhizobium sp. USDA 4532]
MSEVPPNHPLDRPIWSALTTRQRELAEGGTDARRFPLAIAPFADMVDMSPRSFAALGALLSGADIAVLFTPDPVPVPPQFKVLLARPASR